MKYVNKSYLWLAMKIFISHYKQICGWHTLYEDVVFISYEKAGISTTYQNIGWNESINCWHHDEEIFIVRFFYKKLLGNIFSLCFISHAKLNFRSLFCSSADVLLFGFLRSTDFPYFARFKWNITIMNIYDKLRKMMEKFLFEKLKTVCNNTQRDCGCSTFLWELKSFSYKFLFVWKMFTSFDFYWYFRLFKA